MKSYNIQVIYKSKNKIRIVLSEQSVFLLVGAKRFELPTSWTPFKRATKLRYAPTSKRNWIYDTTNFQIRQGEFCHSLYIHMKIASSMFFTSYQKSFPRLIEVKSMYLSTWDSLEIENLSLFTWIHKNNSIFFQKKKKKFKI